MVARHRNQEPDLVQEQESPTADSEAGDEHMPSFEVKHDSRLSRGISRARAYAAARPKRHFVGAFAVLLGVVILLLPSPYVIEMPGPTQDVLGTVEDGAGIDINAQAVWGWANPQVEVMPREATVPVGQSADQYQKKVEQDMAGSQDSASAVGLAYAKAHADELGIDASALQHAKVTMHVDSIGGPSAGMMYTLGLIDKLTPANESGGKTIAGTGTIDKDGKVGRIGGIELKMLGAKRDGATWFLAPASNCVDVAGRVPDGLRDVKVATLNEAYQALVAIGKGQADDLPHCEA